jgi:hypothetical protein
MSTKFDSAFDLAVALTIYLGLGSDFIVRFVQNKYVCNAVTEAEEERPVMDVGTKLMLIGLVLNSLFLFIR